MLAQMVINLMSLKGGSSSSFTVCKNSYWETHLQSSGKSSGKKKVYESERSLSGNKS